MVVQVIANLGIQLYGRVGDTANQDYTLTQAKQETGSAAGSDWPWRQKCRCTNAQMQDERVVRFWTSTLRLVEAVLAEPAVKADSRRVTVGVA
jgi:hypothetical protein